MLEFQAEQVWCDREQLETLQASRLQQLLNSILPRNRFWNNRFRSAGVDPAEIRTTADLRRLPFCTKQDLVQDQASQPPYGSNQTFPSTRYQRLHQTSGTTGRPVRWMDTRDSWDWCMECWRQIWMLAGLQSWDRLFFPFSFGPFLGFWAAFEGALRYGNFCLAGGGMSTAVRLQAMIENEATVLCCTPTYALRMAEVAAAEGVDLKETSIRMVIVAGEPGGSITSTRQQIEQQWEARVIDHWGMTELGSLASESADRPGGMYLLETECIAEVVDAAGNPVADGQTGELVITNLGRTGSPLLRYRTGDLVTVSSDPDPTGRVLRWLQGGILGRVDDMLIIRGNNVFPGSVEAVVRDFPAITEFRLEVSTVQGMKDLCVAVETGPVAGLSAEQLLEQLRGSLRQRLGFSVNVRHAEALSLPRSEMKSRRVVTLD